MAQIGLDLGTTSIKLCVLDSHGRVLDSEQSSHDANIKDGPIGVQDSQRLIQTALDLLLDPKRKWLKIKNISISGQMHGIVLWDEDAVANGSLDKCSDLYTWMYNTSKLGLQKAESWSNKKIYPGYGCATLIELIDEEKCNMFNRCGTIMDLLACYLTGSRDVKQTSHLSESWGLCDRKENNFVWNETFLEYTKGRIILPEIVVSPTVVGHVHERFDCMSDATVYAPVGDLQASVASVAGSGSNPFSSDAAYIIIGTSAQLCTLQAIENDRNFASAPTVNCLSFSQHQNLFAACAMNGGNTLDSLIQMISNWSQELCGDNKNNRNTVDMEKLMSSLDDYVGRSNAEEKLHVKSARFLPERGINEADFGMSITCMNQSSSLFDLLGEASNQIIRNLFELFPISLLEKLEIRKLILVGASSKPRFLKEILKKSLELNITLETSNAQVSAALGSVLLNHEELLP